MNTPYTGSNIPSPADGAEFLHTQYDITKPYRELNLSPEERKRLQKKDKGRGTGLKTIPDILGYKFHQIEAILRHPRLAPHAYTHLQDWLKRYKDESSIDT